MMEAINLSKSFGKVRALTNVSLTAREHEIFGLVGTNGAGKSTFLRIAAGILKPDEGCVLYDSCPVWNNPKVKERFFYIPNDFYFFPGAGAREMGKYFSGVYRRFDETKYLNSLRDFSLNPDTPVQEFSKGMRRLVSVLLGICAGTDYLLLDETFDGLDPVNRQAVKSLFAGEMEDRGLTPVLTSHNLRELEDLCDHIGLLHEGGVLLSKDLDDLKQNAFRVQCVFSSGEDEDRVKGHFKIVEDVVSGRLHSMVIAATREQIESYFRGIDTIYAEILPLSLEEIFIAQTKSAGYDVRKMIAG